VSPLQHLNLLLRWDRTFGLAQAVQDAIAPGDFVLDAGCGSGLLSLLALQAGAEKVVAVDYSDLDLARKLADENAGSDRIEFFQADLGTWDARFERPFDVVFAMLYLNDPRRDEQASDLTYDLCDRFLAADGRCIPDRVRYTAQLCEWPEQDLRSRQRQWNRQVAELETRHGLRFNSLLRGVMEGPPDKELFPLRSSAGVLDRQGARVLSSESMFVELSYRGERNHYPETLQLTADTVGIAHGVIWRQELWYGHTLLFVNESLGWLDQPCLVEPQEEVILTTDHHWRRTNLLMRQPR